MGELVKPGRASEDCFEVYFVGLVVRGNYICCFVVVVIFIGFGRAKRWRKLQSHQLGRQCKPQRGTISTGNRGSHYLILLY